MLVAKVDDKYLIRLDRNEEILSSLKTICQKHKIKAGKVSGIGAVYDVSLGFYDLPTKFYDSKKFEGEFELLSLSGNISFLDGEPFTHLHMTMSDANYQVFGGHLFSAKIAVTGEIWIVPAEIDVERVQNDEIGLNLMSFSGESI
ncbi:MAG: DNA-binding protein [Candidatus Cloacimonetes bacterium]|nr:DNA-binding protein [Candidatus Cloacimonadota bacterium]